MTVLSATERQDQPDSAPPPAGFAPLPHRDLGGLVRDRAARFADRPAFTVCLENGVSATLDYRQVDALSDAFAAYLRHRLGLKAGDRVAVQMPNCLAYPVCTFGVFKAGGVVVNANPLYTATETRHQLIDSGARALVVLDLVARPIAQGALDGSAVETVIVASIADLIPAPLGEAVRAALAARTPPPPDGAVPLARALEEGAGLVAHPPAPARDREDAAVLQYTGGTTGVPKGAELTHGNLLANLAQVLALLGPALRSEGEVAVTALPLYHITAFSALMLLVWQSGGHNVLIPSPRPVANLRPAFERFPVTIFAGVNVMFQGLLREAWFAETPSATLRLTLSGATALHPHVAEEWHDRVGSPIHEGYGMSETSPVVSFNPVDRAPRLGTIGIPLAGTEIRIVDDRGVAVGPGRAGELQVRGPQVMRGYWRRPDETRAVLSADGWLATGDIAVLDADGYLSIVDRKKDMIDVNGFNVYPNEVEACLAQHPQVRECAVVGVRSGDGSETVRAYVVLADPALGEVELRAWCERGLTRYKVPRDFIVLEELPKSAVGKILRKDLRALAAARRD